MNAEKLVSGINNNIMELAKLIENAKTREEADKIYKQIEKINPSGETLAHDVWEFVVDWNNVGWKENKKM